MLDRFIHSVPQGEIASAVIIDMDAVVCVISVLHGPDLFIFERASVCVDNMQMMNGDTTSCAKNYTHTHICSSILAHLLIAVCIDLVPI